MNRVHHVYVGQRKPRTPVPPHSDIAKWTSSSGYIAERDCESTLLQTSVAARSHHRRVHTVCLCCVVLNSAISAVAQVIKIKRVFMYGSTELPKVKVTQKMNESHRNVIVITRV